GGGGGGHFAPHDRNGSVGGPLSGFLSACRVGDESPQHVPDPPGVPSVGAVCLLASARFSRSRRPHAGNDLPVCADEFRPECRAARDGAGCLLALAPHGIALWHRMVDAALLVLA